MNASQFMDKQIMDLSRFKTTSDTINNLVHDDDHEVSETTERDAVAVDGAGGGGGGGGVGKMDEIFPSYDFQPIRPVAGVSTQFDAVGVVSGGNRGRGSMESAQAQTAGLKGYGYSESLVPDKVIHEKAQAIDHSTLVSEIDQTLKKHADNLIHSLDGLGTRVSQLENKMSQLEHKLDDLKITVGNGQGRTDGKLWHLENILREVQSGVQNLKDKQEVMDAQMLLAKLQVSKADQTPASSTQHIDFMQQATSASQQLNQQFPVALEPSLPALPPPHAPLPPPQHIIHPPVPMPAQFAQGQTPTLPQRDQYSPHLSQTTEKRQQFQFPPSQYQQPPTEHLPIAQPPPPLPYNQHPSTAPVNVPSRPQAPPLGYQHEETSYITPQIYPPNLQQSQPIVGPTKQFYGAPPPHANEPNMGRPSSGFQSGYIPQGPTEQYPYSGSPSRYDGSSSIKPSSLSSVMGNPNYQIPTAKLLPQAIPTASTVSSGSGSGGTGNKVPIDDVIDKVTSMGFPRDHVRATVKKLTENGQSVDLNVVLDKLMNDGGMQPQSGWFGR